MQLLLQHCCKTSWKAILRVLPLTPLKLVLQQMRLLQVAWTLTSDWIKLRGNHAIHKSYVTFCKTICLGPVKLGTQHVQIFFARSRTTLYSVTQQLFATWEVCGKKRNITIQFVLQHCCGASCSFRCLFYLPSNISCFHIRTLGFVFFWSIILFLNMIEKWISL